MLDNSFTPTELYFVDQLHKRFAKLDNIHTISMTSEIGLYTDPRTNIDIEARYADHLDVKNFYTEHTQEMSEEEFLNVLMDCEEGGAENGEA